MSLFVSIISPTSDIKDSKLEKAITTCAMKIAQHKKQGNLPEGPGLEVKFMLSGKHDKPSFEGMRMGNYSEKQNVLFFERAVSNELIDSDKANAFVEAVLQDVILNASYFFNELNTPFDIITWKRVLQ